MPRGPTAFIRDSQQALEFAYRELERGRVKEAIEVLEQWVGRDDDRIALHTLLGIAFARMRQVERAFEHLERAVAFDPGGFASRCALGELYLRLRVVDEGRAHLERALGASRTAEDRAYVHRLLREDRARERIRVRRPSFRVPFFPWRRRPPAGGV